MKKQVRKKRSINVDIEYFEDNSEPKKGIYRGGVIEPELKDLKVWVNSLEEYDLDSEKFVVNGNQINIKGDSASLFNLGKLLIAISKYKTEDLDYHVHLDDLTKINNERCEIIIYKDSSH